MYTCCPICKTNFKVTEAQLQVAQGKVRCGSCKNVFNARQHIHYKTLKQATTQTDTRSDKTTSTSTSLPEKETHSQSRHIDTRTTEPTKNFTSAKQTDSELKKTKKEVAQPKEEPATSDIDAIFNALNSQLTSGTYLDIAKPAEKDIREADFDDDFDADINSDEPDLDLYTSNNITKQNNGSLAEAPDNSDVIKDAIETDRPFNIPTSTEQENITPSISKKNTPEKSSGEKDGKEIQQHAFEFKISNEGTSLKENDKIKTASGINDKETVKKDKNAALHQAIDNIIKVDNNIPTPFDEHHDHKDDHFVIEMHSEPDVELVNESDIDKLFASTDSLDISDLKFNKLKQDKSSDEIEIPPAEHNPVFSDAAKEDIDKIEPVHDDTDNFNQQVEEQLNPENFSSDSIQAEEYAEDDFAEDFDSSELETRNESETEDEFDDVEFEEEVILSTPDEHTDVPHRLRDAVASLNHQTMSLKSKIIYISASVLLILLLFFQLILFKSTTLANSLPVLQPFLLSMCDSLPCRYTGNHNSKRIKIISRDVRLHPKIKGALLISATIINQASYKQPYPTIQLKFTDLTGATVAQRYFQPSEYLGLLNKPFALMPAKQPVQLNIEILDPGSDAINFQFFFL